MKTRVRGAKLLLSAGTALTLAIGMLTAGRTASAAVGEGITAEFLAVGRERLTSDGPRNERGQLIEKHGMDPRD
jgi:hypothetical protein